MHYIFGLVTRNSAFGALDRNGHGGYRGVLQTCPKPSTSADGDLPSTCFSFAPGFDTAIVLFIYLANVIETLKPLQHSTRGSGLPDPYSLLMVNPAFSLALLNDIYMSLIFFRPERVKMKPTRWISHVSCKRESTNGAPLNVVGKTG